MKLRLSLALLSSFLIPAVGAHATEVFKNNATGTLNLGTCWDGGTAPGPGDVAVWDTLASSTTNQQLGANLQWAGLKVISPGLDYTVRPSSGLSLTLGSAGVDMSNASKNFTFNSTLNLGANQTWTIAAGRTFTAGALSGSSGFTLTKTGDGMLSLTGSAVTFAGGLEISGGTVLSANASGSQELSGPLFGTGTLSKTAAGTLTLSADNIGFTGTIGLAAGQLNLSHPSALGDGVLAITGGSLGNSTGATLTLASGTQNWNGDFAFGGSSDLNLGTSAVTVSGNRVLTVNSNVLTVSGILGGGGLTKAGAGTLRVVAGATIDLTGKLAVTGGPLKIEGGAATCGAAFEVGTAGVVELNGGVLTVPAVTGLGGSSAWHFNGGTLRAGGGSTAFMGGISNATVGAGGAVIEPNGNTVTLSQGLAHDAALGATADGGLRVRDEFNGTVRLTGAGTFTGPTVIESGTLELGPGGSLNASPTIEVKAGGTFGTGTGYSVVAGQTLRGQGSIHGKLTVGPGAILSPGDLSAGTEYATLLLDDRLVLQGEAEFQIRKGGLDIDSLAGLDQVTYGGTLTVTAAAGTSFSPGDNFKLFDAATQVGAFATFNLPPLPSGWFWRVGDLLVDGSITVINTVPPPIFNPPAGGYIGAQSVTLSSATGSTIYFTTDGTDPLTSGTTQSGTSPVVGIAVPNHSADFTIQAYAAKAGAAASAVATAVYHTSDTAIWTTPGSGLWLDAANWLNGAVGGGVATTADFSTLTLGGGVTVTLDGSCSIGTLKFGDVGAVSGWALTQTDGTSILTLANGAATPVIQVGNATTTITAPLAGSQGFVKTGAGTLVAQLAKPALSGTVTISQGNVAVDRTSALGTGSLVLGDAATGAMEAGILQRGSDPWPPAADFGTTNDILVAAGPTGRLVIGRQNSGNYAANFSGIITLNNNVVFRNNGADRLSIDGKITGTGNVTIESAGGTRVNWGDTGNDFVGDITVASGAIFQPNGASAVPATSNLTLIGSMGTNIATGQTMTFGALNGTGTIYRLAGGNPTLALGGTGANGDFQGVIQNDFPVTKSGSGTQIFSGSSTYTGTTTVHGGVLRLTNTTGSATGSGAVEVKTGATLGGTGAASGTVLVNSGGFLAPGNQGAGTLTTGSTILAGTFACQLDGANCGRLAVTGNLDLTGATLAVAVLAGGSVPEPYVIATYTGTRTGTFASVPAGCAVDYATPNQVKLTVSGGGYASWIASSGLTGDDALPGADPDHDGLANSIEFVVGGNPATVMNAALLPTMALVTNPGGGIPDGSYLKFTFRRTPASAYLNPGIEYDADLTGVWAAAAGAPGAVQVVAPGFYATPTPADKVDVYVPRAGNQVNGKLFGRLRVSVP